jgi:uncharacterized BrkB/YihY/UPF0761 family membrane protein
MRRCNCLGGENVNWSRRLRRFLRKIHEAAGPLVVVFVWVYYSAQILLMEAEFSWAYASTSGSRKHQPVPDVAT